MEQQDTMSRRTALKIIGSAALGIAAAATGAAGLAGCSGQGRKRLIFYFTGTGNCLHIARELADANTELLSIPQMMKQGRFDFAADEIGIVYPVYGHIPPNMVRRFVEKARLKADYKFAVLTYGNRKCNSVEIWDEISAKAENRFDYITTLIMVDNWLPNFDMNEQMKIDKRIPESVARVKADIGARRRWLEPVTEEEREQHRGFLERSGIDPAVGFLKKSEDCFAVTGDCIGCGVCVAVCPRGNYELTGRGVRMAGDCEFCFACIQNCPQKAIQFAKSDDPLLARGEKNPAARYRNEHVSLADIKRANDQF